MEEKIKVKDFIEKKLKDPDFRKIYEKNKESISSMEYVIHSNELEGNDSTEKEIEFLLKVALGEISTEKAIKEIIKKEIVFHNRE